MNRTKFYIILVIAAAMSMVFQSCGNRLGDSLTLAKTKMETEFASTADLLIDNMIDSYKNVEDLTFQNEFDGAVASILSRSVDSYEPSQLVDDNIRKKINLLYLYKQAFHEYERLAADGFTAKQESFTNCCNAIIDAYNALGDTMAVSISNEMSKKFKERRYNENLVAHELIEALVSVWTKDSKSLVADLNRNFCDYQTTLSLIGDEAFNEDKLSKYVSQPYEGKHNLVEVYKINLIKERRNQLNSYVQLQDNVTISLQYLDEALENILGKADKDIVMNYLNRVKLRLDPVTTVQD